MSNEKNKISGIPYARINKELVEQDNPLALPFKSIKNNAAITLASASNALEVMVANRARKLSSDDDYINILKDSEGAKYLLTNNKGKNRKTDQKEFARRFWGSKDLLSKAMKVPGLVLKLRDALESQEVSGDIKEWCGQEIQKAINYWDKNAVFINNYNDTHFVAYASFSDYSKKGKTVNNAGGGNCLFYALLDASKGKEELREVLKTIDYKKLRKQLCDWIEKSPVCLKELDGIVELDPGKDYEDIRRRAGGVVQIDDYRFAHDIEQQLRDMLAALPVWSAFKGKNKIKAAIDIMVSKTPVDKNVRLQIEGYLELAWPRRDKLRKEYIKYMRNYGSWGDMAVVRAFSEKYKTDVVCRKTTASSDMDYVFIKSQGGEVKEQLDIKIESSQDTYEMLPEVDLSEVGSLEVPITDSVKPKPLKLDVGKKEHPQPEEAERLRQNLAQIGEILGRLPDDPILNNIKLSVSELYHNKQLQLDGAVLILESDIQETNSVIANLKIFNEFYNVYLPAIKTTQDTLKKCTKAEGLQDFAREKFRVATELLEGLEINDETFHSRLGYVMREFRVAHAIKNPFVQSFAEKLQKLKQLTKNSAEHMLITLWDAELKRVENGDVDKITKDSLNAMDLVIATLENPEAKIRYFKAEERARDIQENINEALVSSDIIRDCLLSYDKYGQVNITTQEFLKLDDLVNNLDTVITKELDRNHGALVRRIGLLEDLDRDFDNLSTDKIIVQAIDIGLDLPQNPRYVQNNKEMRQVLKQCISATLQTSIELNNKAGYIKTTVDGMKNYLPEAKVRIEEITKEKCNDIKNRLEQLKSVLLDLKARIEEYVNATYHSGISKWFHYTKITGTGKTYGKIKQALEEIEAARNKTVPAIGDISKMPILDQDKLLSKHEKAIAGFTKGMDSDVIAINEDIHRITGK